MTDIPNLQLTTGIPQDEVNLSKESTSRQTMEEAVQLGASRKRAAQRFLQGLIAMPMVMLPFLLGGARPWFWSTVAGLFMLGAAALLWIEKAPLPLPTGLSRKWAVMAGAILAYPFIQSAPIPASWLGAASPQRLFWIEKAAEVTHLPAFLTSISYVPLTTVFAGVWLLFLAVYALLFRRVVEETGGLDLFFQILFVVAGLEAFYGLLQVLIPSLGVLWEAEGQGIARGTFVNRNHYAAFLGMTWPLLLAYVLSLKGAARSTERSIAEKERRSQLGQKQLFLVFIVGLILLALFFSRSRGGILGAMIALTVFVSLGRLQRRGIILFVAGCWLVMIGYGSIIGFDEILARFDRIDAEASGRFLIWKDTWRLIRDHALTGVGLGGYGTVFHVYQSFLPETLRASHAHNDYLQLAAELGLPMAAAVVVLLWGYWFHSAWNAVRSHRLTQEPSQKGGGRESPANRKSLIPVGALAGSAAFLFHGWAEFNWQIPANQLTFVMLLVLMRDDHLPRTHT